VVESQYVTHPLIKEGVVERRTYQIAIAATALMHNTLAILPTGLGKTAIALLVIASRLHNKSGKALVLAPTKPLVEQHAEFLRRTLKIEEEQIVALSGEISPDKRAELWKKATIVVSTPQVIENDILAGRISLHDVIHLTFDEAHRAVGNYAYVFIAKKYLESNDPLILAITASPSSDVERIQEVIENLGIEEIEIRTEHDADVRPYIHEKVIDWIRVEMPTELKEVRQKFLEALKLRFKKLKKFSNVELEEVSKKELLAFQETLQAKAVETRNPKLFEAISILAEIMKIQHGIELIETQGLDALKHYLRRLVMEARSKGGSKAAKSIIGDVVFREAVLKAMKCEIDHPKVEKLKEIVRRQIESNPDSRIIVFTNFRDTTETISKELNRVEGIKASKFTGQASRIDNKGMGQREQVEILQRFRDGEINVLVATSVGEEGLDIPSTDLVVFYEAVPSEIRAIQRKGRTGRIREGRIVVLMTKGTRDEGYYWASFRKERMMYEKLYEIRDKLRKSMERRAIDRRDGKQRSLEDFASLASILVYADAREAKSGVVRRLYEMGIGIRTGNLDVADYVVSDRVAIERKTIDDFLESLINKERLFTQLLRLKNSYSRPILIIEGENMYSRRMIHPNAIRGALAAIAVDFEIPLIYTSSPEDTAELIAAIARREQEVKEREVVLHTGKTKKTLKEQQEYVVSAISDIGPTIAKNLLRRFQTIEKIATANEEELVKVPKVGKKIAEKIRRVMATPYDEDS
jgi:Fanconi anemia group M protein